MALDLAGNFFTEDFAQSIAGGLSFLAHNEPPYCVHCTEGKDRAGFATMLMAALMGATLEEITDDYMLSFRNYYGITKEGEPERYKVVLDNNLYAILYHITGTSSYKELAQVNLEEAVTKYLIDAGMTKNDILALKNNLR